MVSANIPDSAVEAAAEAMHALFHPGCEWEHLPDWRDVDYGAAARAALSAALPALREELATEIEALAEGQTFTTGAQYAIGVQDAAHVVRANKNPYGDNLRPEAEGA